jgi:hypothetical protein
MILTSRCIIAWVAVSFIAISAGAAAAPDQTPIQREYDIRDQIIERPSFTFTTDPTTQPATMVTLPQPTRQQLVDQVEQWLRDSTAEPGADIQITESKGTIQVTATAEPARANRAAAGRQGRSPRAQHHHRMPDHHPDHPAGRPGRH